jgi:class 3 adenylate cyclase
MSLKDVRGVVGTTCNLADLYLSMHDVTSAEAAMRSLDDWPITEPPLTARIALHKGNISLRNNDIDAAEAHFRHALEICRSTVLLMEQSTAYIGLQEVARNRNDLAKYIEYNTEQQRIKEQILGKETVLRIASQETERRIAAERQEREKERAVLYSTLPKNIADRIVRGERITGDQFEEAAVIFVDIVSFTKISAHMDASDVVDFLERLFSLFDAICKTHSITKIKTIGDSYMAVAFPESTRADDAPMDTPAMRAARASLDMLEGMGGFTQPENLRIRIGMHVGPVTAGVLGTERLQYDVWGDTVNVASRLESTSEPGRIHVSQQFADALTSNLAPGTWHAAHGTWHVALRGDTELKGKGTMTTYWLEPRGPFPAS